MREICIILPLNFFSIPWVQTKSPGQCLLTFVGITVRHLLPIELNNNDFMSMIETALRTVFNKHPSQFQYMHAVKNECNLPVMFIIHHLCHYHSLSTEGLTCEFNKHPSQFQYML